MSNSDAGQRCNRISVCPLSGKSRRMRSQEGNKCEEYITDLKRGEQVYAVKSYSDQRNNAALTFAEGDIITLLDQFSDGMCKGFISRLGQDSKIGVFPTTCVVPFTKNNINSSNTTKLPKSTRRNLESKEKQKLINYPVAIREKEKSALKEGTPRGSDSGHMYSCNYIEIKKSPNTDNKSIIPSEALNRGSTCSVDSGRGSTTVTMMNSMKMNMVINPLSAFDQTQFMIPENYASQSIESGLASYQRHSSSSSSSIGGGSSTDGSKLNIGFTENEHRQILNTTFEEEDRDGNIIKTWLQTMNLDMYTSNFLDSGYDFNTLLRMTPEDLNAIGITNPKHRKLIKSDISSRMATIKDNLSEPMPATVEEWLMFLNLSPYLEIILQQGYHTVEKVTDITWEDLEEIGINKLGHQKKIMLAVERLKKLMKTSPSEKLSMSFSAENFRDQKSQFQISDTPPNYRTNYEGYGINPAYLDLSKHSIQRPIAPNRYTIQQSNICASKTNQSMYSPVHSGRSSLLDTSLPPPTPKRISSIMSSPKDVSHSSHKSSFRKPYENIVESFELYPNPSKSDKDPPCDQSTSPLPRPTSPSSNARYRSSSIMVLETNSLPFANENCGTIKQRSSSLDRTDILREEIEFGVLSLKTNLLQAAKPVLPLTLPYNIDSLSYKSTNSSQKLKVNINSERNIQIIPTDVHVAVREKVPMPKLHIEDNSSNEDFNEICDMLGDLTELLDKEVAQNH